MNKIELQIQNDLAVVVNGITVRIIPCNINGKNFLRIFPGNNGTMQVDNPTGAPIINGNKEVGPVVIF